MLGDHRGDAPGDGGALASRYEDLRAVALARRTAGGSHGLALFGAKGMTAWMTAWRDVGPAVPGVAIASTAPPPPGGTADVVAVLAAMASACLEEAER